MSGVAYLEGKESFSRFDFESWSVEESLEFLEITIDLRVKYLNQQLDSHFTSSIDMISRRLNLPFRCRKELDEIKESLAIDSKKFEQELSRIETTVFGA